LKKHNQTDGMMYQSLTVEPNTSFKTSDSNFNVLADSVLEQLFDKNAVSFEAMSATSVGTKVAFKKIQKFLDQKSEKFFHDNILQDPLGCKQIFVSTLAQNQSPRWFTERKLRITASKAHKILNARKLETQMKYFFESPPLTASMAYGTAMEKKAKEHYSQVTGNSVFDSGLILKHSQSWLCASPDGFLEDAKTCIEIKCPSSCENSKISVNYLKNGTLSPSHPYFTQVQLQMYVSNAKLCHFFVFSEADFVLVEVQRDDNYL